MKFLGLRNGHDANFTYTDGCSVKYVKLERQLQVKHYKYDPDDRENDIPFLLAAVQGEGIDLSSLDAICINTSNDRFCPKSGIKSHETYTLIDKKVDPFFQQFSCPVYAIDHHWAHVLSCWPMVAQLPAVNLVVDGIGDFDRQTSVFHGGKLQDFIHYAETPGVSTTLDRLGIAAGLTGLRLDMSGKMMALMSYHNLPEVVVERFERECLTCNFRHLELLRAVAGEHAEYFGNDKQGHINAAFVVHLWAARTLPKYLKLWADPQATVTYSGGTAQNTWINSHLRHYFPNLIIPPHCPDEGISLGCVEFLRQEFFQEPFDSTGFPFWQSDQAPTTSPSQATIEETAEALAQGKIVGWYQGHGEIGPRALGHRSILMDPSIKDGKDRINKVKKRESFRPFGATVLEKHAEDYFELGYPSPYMLYVAKVKSQDLPAITHIDGTCRHQTVSEYDQGNEAYYSLIEAFEKKTGLPILLNTSLNVDGKPIAAYVEDAKTLFDSGTLDMMVVGDEIWRK